jgi:archaellum component FlaG (FlaF/FlaG flagellin family)
MARLAALFLAAALSFAAPASEINLSATISVPQAVFRVEEAKKLNVSFTVTNSGTAAVDVDTGSSQLFINGEAQKEWATTIVNGAGASYFRPLPAGQTLLFTYQLGPRYFSKPGVYKIRWKGPYYETPEITFRVVPD